MKRPLIAPDKLPKTRQGRYALAVRLLKVAVKVKMQTDGITLSQVSSATGIAADRLADWLSGRKNAGRTLTGPPVHLPKISLIALGDWVGAPFSPEDYEPPAGFGGGGGGGGGGGPSEKRQG